MLRQHRQRRGHILVLHQNAMRHVQMHGCKVPDGLDAVGDQQVADLLRVRGRHGDDADINLLLAANALQL